MAPSAAKRTTLEEDIDTDSRAVVEGKLLYGKNQTLH